ncbi:recombinase RecT [Fusobacterium massiliense]|uniref:recombinase RecT n=1 Tax=Fusobacterium massiliense TaxID=1852365 RepID=UPI0028D25011|nr:recombinase RecT [Fusobacterium massiliense]
MSTTAKNSLTGANGTSVAKKENKQKTIFDVIQAGAKQFATALPKHINSERFVRIAITTIRQNPKLAQCSQESLLGALMVSAQLGLEPGTLGQCYLIPYGRECQFQIGYKGMIELLRRSGQLKDIYAYSVYENDEFEMTYGLERNLKHKPNLQDRGNFIGCYCVAVLKDDARAFEYMTKEEIEVHGKKFSKTYGNGPWKTDFEAMAHKTVVKKMLKWLPLSVEFLEMTNNDEKSFKLNESKENEYDDLVVVDDEMVVNEETGEVVEEKYEKQAHDDTMIAGMFAK